MRVVVAVDRSDPTFKLVQAVTRLYTPIELTLVHAVDHGLAQYPATGPAGRGTVPEELRPLLDSGQKLLAQAAKSVPSELNLVVKQVCELGNAARVIINTAQMEAADLIVTGARELSSEEREFTVGSVSHRIASHASCTDSSRAGRREWDRRRGANPTLALGQPLSRPRRDDRAACGADAQGVP